MRSSREKQINRYVSDWCWNNLGGDIDWDNNVYAHVLKGVEIAEKEFKKKIKDKYNALNSQLQETEHIKLGKRVNLEKVAELKVKLELLKQLMK